MSINFPQAVENFALTDNLFMFAASDMVAARFNYKSICGSFHDTNISAVAKQFIAEYLTGSEASADATAYLTRKVKAHADKAAPNGATKNLTEAQEELVKSAITAFADTLISLFSTENGTQLFQQHTAARQSYKAACATNIGQNGIAATIKSTQAIVNQLPVGDRTKDYVGTYKPMYVARTLV